MTIQIMSVFPGGPGPYRRPWVYECGVCQKRKKFPDKRPRRPVCHNQLMELVSDPSTEESES